MGPQSGVRRRITLLGMPLDCMRESEAVATVQASLVAGRGGWIITANLDHLRQFHRRDDLRQLFDEADLVLADGMPLVWASRLQKTPLPERVAGSTLVGSLTAAAASIGASVFLLGGSPGTAARAAARLRESNPSLEVAGVLCPSLGFERDAAAWARVASAVTAARPDIAYVGLGFPKQEKLIAGLRRLLPQTWFVGVGVTFSFLSGEIARAPVGLQRAGLEWVHRLAQEPRLFRRYVIQGIPFGLEVIGRALLAGRLPRGAGAVPRS
jgi:N-acetylglucosaminyldiphosphoundecaprenol N-acetyl-beta-D-mannosaminyltransferase